MANVDANGAILTEILASIRSLQKDHAQLASTVDAVSSRVNALSGTATIPDKLSVALKDAQPGTTASISNGISTSSTERRPSTDGPRPDERARRVSVSGAGSKITLTSYPGQSGVDPIPLLWGHPDPAQRGPIVVSRAASTIRRRNAIGAHGGSYSTYFALAVAQKNLGLDHKPDFTNTEPAVDILGNPTWGDPKKMVAMDPFGHLAPWLYADTINSQGVDIRPTIAVTKAHMKLPELENSVRNGRLKPDGKICLNETGELAVTKVAVEPVWYLPGVAERFGIDEGTLRRSLFENTGGSYPELITRHDIKVFLPPIGGLTVYIFGDPANMKDTSKRLSLRIHDECNGSDVFGSDICTCRPYLIFGVEEAVKEAQNGGSGVVIYFRKEGRALGEVTKYLVYNARKRGADKASEYFKRTENIAGVKDMRFQALMPDVSSLAACLRIVTG